MGYPITNVLDDFNRADTGPPPSGSWTTSYSGGHLVASNVCAVSGVSGGASSWSTQFKANQEVYFTLSTLPVAGEGLALNLRLQTVSDYFSDNYQLDLIVVVGGSNDVLRISKSVSTVFTQLGADIALGADLATSDVVGLRAVGSTIETFRNGASVATRTDSDVTAAGYVGIYSGGVVSRVDDFGGGGFSTRLVPGELIGGHLTGGTLAR